jgi:hypothetical protein
MKSLWFVTVARVLVYCGYAAVAAYVVLHVAGRSATQPPTATRTLLVNERLLPGDLETSQTAAMTGRYAKEVIEAGRPVTQAMLSDRPVPPPLGSALAAIVVMPDALRRSRHIGKGTEVQIMRGPTVVAAGKVLDPQCDTKVCSVIVGLADKPAFDPAALAAALPQADLVPTPPADPTQGP